MFVVIPYDTDADRDHKPWATGALILVNVAVVVVFGYTDWTVHDPHWGPAPEPPFANSLALRWGSLNPIQWITHAFVHGGFIHFLFNMIFLWTFGLVVEGAVGWKRFLALYGLTAAVVGVAGQLMMLGTDHGGAMGASGAISGLMAISLLWAPRSRLRVFVWILVIVRRPEVTVFGFCLLWLGLDVLFVLLSGFAMSGALGHVAGAGVGLCAGVFMLKKKLVDFEGWDFLTLRKEGVPAYRIEVEEPVEDVDLLTRFVAALDKDDGPDADRLARQLSAHHADWAPNKGELSRLIHTLRRADRERCFERMQEFISRYPDGSISVRIMAAELLLELGRAAAAREHLESLDDHALTDAQRRARDSILTRAQPRRGGGLELE